MIDNLTAKQIQPLAKYIFIHWNLLMKIINGHFHANIELENHINDQIG